MRGKLTVTRDKYQYLFVVLIRAPPPSNDFLGFVSDKSLLEWFTSTAQSSPTLSAFASASLASLALPSLYLYTSVIATKASDTVLDAMRLMSDYGVSSVAVIEEEGGRLLSAISVTDIGKVSLGCLRECCLENTD